MSAFIDRYPEVLNLSEDELKVFRFLNQEGESAAKIISYRCDIPFSKIHTVLYILQQKELIFSHGEKPTLFTLRSRDPKLARYSA